jgi:hypothetical protein
MENEEGIEEKNRRVLTGGNVYRNSVSTILFNQNHFFD